VPSFPYLRAKTYFARLFSLKAAKPAIRSGATSVPLAGSGTDAGVYRKSSIKDSEFCELQGGVIIMEKLVNGVLSVTPRKHVPGGKLQMVLAVESPFESRNGP
jgi:hypothetical protein